MFDPEDTDAPSDDALLMDAPPADDQSDDQPPADDKPDDRPPADDKPSEGEEGGEDGDEEEDKPEGAPEEYADFELPEGFELDAAALDAFKPIAKELNLSQEQAQRLVTLQTENAQRWADQLVTQHIEQRTSWREASTNDSEFGGAGLAQNLATAKQAREAFGTPELSKLLNETGLGDHPEVIRYFYRVGKATSEHDFVNTGKPAKQGGYYDHPTSKPRE